MRRLCAWCKKDLDIGELLTDEEYIRLNKVASHGMCRECLKHEEIELKKPEVKS